jgi:hypothetical protein
MQRADTALRTCHGSIHAGHIPLALVSRSVTHVRMHVTCMRSDTLPLQTHCACSAYTSDVIPPPPPQMSLYSRFSSTADSSDTRAVLPGQTKCDYEKTGEESLAKTF